MRPTALIAAALAVGAVVNIAAIIKARAEVRITNDPGGSYAAYVAKVQGLHMSGEHVVIDGPCMSACTLHLNLPPGQVCATSRAVLGFHSAVDGQFGFPLPETNRQLMAAYPPAVRDWIARQGGLWLHVITVRGTAFLPHCK